MTRCGIDRRAVSLIELMIVMSTASMIFLLTVGWIHKSMTISSLMQTHQRNHVQLQRIARNLRADAAIALDIQQNGQEVTIQLSDRSIVQYVIEEHELRRRVTGVADSVGNESSNLLYERFHLSSLSRARWVTDERSESVALVVNRAASETTLQSAGAPQAQSMHMPVELYVVLSPWLHSTTSIAASGTEAER
ncbi:MAG: hypothetical protein AAGC97_10455 [Planctomycetota bacterium]